MVSSFNETECDIDEFRTELMRVEFFLTKCEFGMLQKDCLVRLLDKGKRMRSILSDELGYTECLLLI